MCKKFVDISKDSKRYSQTGRNHSRDQRKFKAFISGTISDAIFIHSPTDVY